MIMMLGIKRRMFPIWSIMMILMCLTTRPSKVHSLEAKGTPSSSSNNEELTSHQREQLALLDQHISSSPNPSETLQQIAESNNMSTLELQQMLESARTAQQGSALVSSTVPSVVSKFVSSVVLFLFRLAKVHPRQFYICILAFASIYYATYNIPRNGLIISTGPSAILFLSHGRTTFCKPPRAFIVSSLLKLEQSKEANNKEEASTPSVLSQKFYSTKMPLNQVTTKKNNKGMKYSITSRTAIPIHTDNLMQQLIHDENNITMEEAEDKELQYTWNAASSILNSRRFAEYMFETASNKRGNTTLDISFQTTKSVSSKEEEEEEVAAIIVKGMGDFGRYGIQPLRLALYKDTVDKNNDMHRDDNDDLEGSSPSFIVVAYSTLSGGHWDGELCITVDAIKKEGNPTQLAVSVSILIPKGGRMLRTVKLSTQLVTALSESICHSIVLETQRIVAQKYRRQKFLQKTHGLAREKQHSRNENAKKLEEMQENRRRRRNGNGGYRPGGPRIRHRTQQTKFMM